MKINKKKFFIRSLRLLFVGFLLSFVASFFFWPSKDFYLQHYYDWTHDNKEVIAKSEIDAIFDKFELVPYKKLPKSYLKKTFSDSSKFKKMLQKSSYYIVPQSELNRYLVGHYRIKHFMGKDQLLKDCILGKSSQVIWLMDKRVIYKTLELQKALQKEGYNHRAMMVTNGHRQPQYNEKIKGARSSRHILGEAVDMTIYDINKDGVANMEDKKIVLDLLDKKIIKNSGGIGLYPGTQAIHYDVRGRRARWNSFKR